jgi:catechol 2,3-dioxygenase-like lactoylglutathione lyase family enzyme
MTETAPFITGVDFVAVPTADYEAASAFYGEVLGLPFLKRWGQMPAGEFQAGNLTLALMQSDAFGLQFRSGNTPIALQVEDVAAARARLEEQGVEFRADTLDSGVCHQAFFADPDGNPLILHHRYAPKP